MCLTVQRASTLSRTFPTQLENTPYQNFRGKSKCASKCQRQWCFAQPCTAGTTGEKATTQCTFYKICRKEKKSRRFSTSTTLPFLPMTLQTSSQRFCTKT